MRTKQDRARPGNIWLATRGETVLLRVQFGFCLVLVWSHDKQKVKERVIHPWQKLQVIAPVGLTSNAGNLMTFAKS